MTLRQRLFKRIAGPARRFVAATAVALGMLSIGAAPAAPATPPEAEPWSQLVQPVFQSYGGQSGLGNLVATDLAQDSDGFLWVGTQGGLSRWDGYRFRNYTTIVGDPHSLPDNFIVALHRDRRGFLWVGTMNGGLARYRPESDDFVTYNSKNSQLSAGGVRSIAGDDADGLWIGTDGGLDHMVGVADPAHARITHLRHDGAGGGGPPADAIKAVYVDPQGTLWVASRKGLARRDRRATGFVQVPLPDSAVVSTLFMDSTGRLWIGTRDRGVFVLPSGGGEVGRFADSAEAAALMKSEIITGVTEAAGGDIWISSFAGGIAIVEHATGRLRRVSYDGQAPGGVASGMLRGLLTDRAGSIWLATDSGLSWSQPGLAAMSLGKRRDDRPGLSDIYYNSMALTSGGQIWAGSVRHGADLIDPRRGTVTSWQPRRLRDDDPTPATQISALLSDQDGTVWTATRAGLYRSAPDGGTATRVAAPWLASGLTVRALARTGDLLWIGTTTEGVYQARYDPRAGLEKVRHVEGLSGIDVTTMRAGPAGSMWVGTRTGLNRVDIASGAVVERILGNPLDAAALSNAYVNALHTDRRGRLWVGSNGGIDVMESGAAGGTRRFHRLGLAQGMPNLIVGALLEDRQGRVWSSTDDGIAVVDPDSFAIGRLGRADGVLYSPYWSHSGVVTATGELVFGGSGGITIVRPERYRPWSMNAQVVVTEVVLGGKPVASSRYNGASTAPLVVQANANSFSVGFAALDFTAPELNRYAYRLEGFDSDWIAVDAAHRVAAYTNLPPGQYQLAIRGSNRGGIWSAQTLRMGVTVLPWWYQTWWFRAAVSLLVVGALYGAYRLRMLQLAAQREALEREVAARTTEVLRQKALAEAARARAEEATQAKSIFLANMSHEIRTPMNAVIGLSYLALNAESPFSQRDHLQKIHRAGTSLLGIISGILDFSKIEAGKVEIETADFDLDELLAHVVAVSGEVGDRPLECNFVVPSDVPRLLRGDALRLGQVLINLLNNALKFTQRGEVVLAVRILERGTAGSRLEFSVRDSGIGMTPDQLDRLFQAFSQADSSSTRKFGGTGLGLSICKNLIELMGGTIRVESQAGVGSRFTVELRLEHAAETLAPAFPLPAALDGIRVLVVDANPTARAALQATLDNLGLDAVVAGSPAEALNHLRDATAPFDLLLADAPLPAPGDTRPLKFARLTTNAADETQGEGHAAGVDAVLAKPVTRAGLIGALLRLFAPERAGFGWRQEVPHFSGARVLLAEDNTINQEIMVSMLRECGIEVDVASDGRAAIGLLQARDVPDYYQLVLMDLHMPEIDGHTVARRLRQDRRFDALPIIAVTASVLPDERRRCKEAGFNDHLGKPLIPAELHRTLRRYLSANVHAATPRRGESAAAPAMPESVPGLDLKHARECVNGNDALLLKVLHMFVRDERDRAVRIRAALTAADYDTAERHAHSLRSVAESLGAGRLALLADEFERAVRHRPAPEALAGALDALDAALAGLCAGLDRCLPSQQVIDGGARAPAAWLDELRRLDELMRESDDQVTTLFASRAVEFTATFGSWDAEAIQRCLDRRDFDGAHAALRWVIHKHELAL